MNISEATSFNAKELDAIAETPCEDCGNTDPVLFLDPPCHDAPSYAFYEAGSGSVVLLCWKCDEPYLSLALSVGGH